MKRFVLAAAALVASLSLASNKAEAAPQILAALPVESGIELTCANGICAAQLSTYCLQRERDAPSRGTAYVPARPEHFTLVLNSEDGAEVRVPAGDHMAFIENRGFMSVAASVELGRLKALGATSAKIVVWPEASLIPVPQPNDPNPLTEEEIAYVTDSLRVHGKDYVDDKPEAATAQLLAKLNSALPSEGPIASTSFDGMWQHVIGDEIPLSADNPGLSGARDAYEVCVGGKGSYHVGGLQRCLDFYHDDLIRNLNVDYWKNQPTS